MNYKKLALASAIALVPSMAFSAMEEMGDSAMSDVTGQDGIKLVWTGTSISMDVGIHDKDGLSGFNNAYSFDGGILIKGMAVGFAGGITVQIDAGNNVISGAGSSLNINVALPNPTTIVTGSIQVGNSGRDEAAAASQWTISNLSATIMDTATIVLGATTLNIQLGNEPQGNMIALSSTITNGINLNSFALNDAGGSTSGGGIKASSITILDTGGSNLTLNVGANISNTGLVLTLGQVGAASGMDIRIADLRLGSTNSAILGDISITGLNINNTTLTISGNH